jgi:Resolvase, N terminal domain
MQNQAMIYGYARVSTEAQDLSGQLAQLKAAGCEKVFREKITGATVHSFEADGRPFPRRRGYHPAVDRLSRDTTDLLVIAREMQQAGAGIRSLAEPFLDTTSDFAEIVFAIRRGGEARTPPHSQTHSTRPRRREGRFIIHALLPQALLEHAITSWVDDTIADWLESWPGLGGLGIFALNSLRKKIRAPKALQTLHLPISVPFLFLPRPPRPPRQHKETLRLQPVWVPPSGPHDTEVSPIMG